MFGLYAAHVNRVALSALFRDGSWHDFRATVETAACSGPARACTTPDILAARGPGRVPGVDSQGKVAFDFGHPAAIGDTVFIAEPLAWTGLSLR